MNSTVETARDPAIATESLSCLVFRSLSEQGGEAARSSRSSTRADPLSAAASTVMGELACGPPEAALAAREAEIQRMSALFMELNHRVINSLQLAASMLSLQARRIQDGPSRRALQDSADRLQALTLFHSEVPATGAVSGAEFRRCLSKLCLDLTQTTHLDLTVDIEPLELPAETTKLLALIVNELVTNAIKHAYPGDRRGPLGVSCHQEPGGKVRLTVADSGVGLPAGFDPSGSSGLGMTIVRLLADQMRGRIEIGRQRGTQYSIVVPVATPGAHGNSNERADGALPWPGR